MRREEDSGRCIILDLGFDQRVQAAHQVQFLLGTFAQGAKKIIGEFYQPRVGDKNLYIGTYQVCVNVFFPTPFLDKLGICSSQLIRWTLVYIESRKHLLVCAPQGID